MNKTITALVAASVIGFATLASAPAEARWRGGGAVAAGVIGGIAAGALIAGAANAGPPPGYYAPAPVYGPGPGCYYQRQRVWDDYYGVWRRGPRVLVCP